MGLENTSPKRTRRPRVRDWPKIRRLELTHKTVWEVDTGYTVTPRIRQRFDTEDMALAFAERLRVRRENEGLRGFAFTVDQRLDAEAALAKLASHGISLREVSDFYLKHAAVRATSKTVREVWNELRDFKERVQHKRPSYLHDLKYRLGAFASDFGDRLVCDIKPKELESWLYDDHSISDLTRRNYYAYLSVFFNFAQGKRDRRKPSAAPYRLDNPVEAVPRPHFEKKPPKILSVDQARHLLKVAKETQEELGMLPYVALGLFCGLRASELAQLTWEEVQMRRGHASVPTRIAKGRRIRNVPIPANAMAWLTQFTDSKGSIAPIPG